MKYSFVILIDDIESLNAKLKAIKTLPKTQIILIGPEEYNRNYENYIVDDLSDVSKAFNKSINLISGEYINFSYSSSYIKKSSLNKLNKCINKYITKHIYRFTDRRKSNTKKAETYPIDIEKISTIEKPTNASLIIDGYFFPRYLLKNFDENLGNHAPIDYIIKRVYETGECIKFNNDFIYNSHVSIASVRSEEASNKSWYTPFIKNYILKTLKDTDSLYIKHVCYYLILARFIANINDKDKGVLDEKELNEFYSVVKEALQYIPDELILNFKNGSISNSHNNTMILLKNENFYDNINKNQLFNTAINTVLVVCAINNEKDNIVIDLEYDGKEYISSGIEIVAKLDDKSISINETSIYSDNTFFHKTVSSKYTFNIKIPKKDLTNDSKLKFILRNNNQEDDMYIGFNNGRVHARLNNIFPNSSYKYDKDRLIQSDRKTIFFRKRNAFERFILELKLYKDFITKSRKKKLGFQALFLRIIYRITKFYYKNKHIWITFDKLYKAGDNGEYFYQYCKNNEDGIRCYYIINKNAFDYKRLKSDKYVAPFKSLKSYLAVLNSECVFATHAGANNFMAFTSGKEKYFRDLFNYDLFCLQHGLTIQDIPHLQNRLRDNTKLYFCASPNEIKNLEQPKYDYPKSALLKTGIARYDGLKNNDKKEILITPTWRASMANTVTIIGGTRPYYEGFKETEYFKIFNCLINNKKLIEAAKKYGYMISYLLHPTLTSQIDDFDKNDYVKIFTVTEDQSYEKLLTESSLMVTDYSGVQYDFAYQRKPILYFHPDELPPHYGAGGIDYEKEGFGPIIKTIDELVDELVKKMSENCKNDDKYIKRADKFFFYNDFNTCKRIYDETIKYLKTKQ